MGGAVDWGALHPESATTTPSGLLYDLLAADYCEKRRTLDPTFLLLMLAGTELQFEPQSLQGARSQ